MLSYISTIDSPTTRTISLELSHSSRYYSVKTM